MKCLINDHIFTLFRPGSSNQPIWSTYMFSSYYDTCYGTSNSCPSTSVTSCTHSEDVAVECSMLI